MGYFNVILVNNIIKGSNVIQENVIVGTNEIKETIIMRQYNGEYQCNTVDQSTKGNQYKSGTNVTFGSSVIKGAYYNKAISIIWGVK